MTADQIVGLLNDAVATDAQAVQALLTSPVPCNVAMLDHPTIICWGPDETPEGVPKVGLLGIINGIAAIDGAVIESVYGETGALLGFRRRP